MEVIKNVFFSMAILVVSMVCSSFAAAAERSPVVIPRTDTPPTIDGRLDEDIWNSVQGYDAFYTTKPVFGDKAEFRTELYLCQDSDNLYVAFRCHDPKPELLRANFLPRDQPGEEDWAAIVFDIDNEETSGVGFVLNPVGVQTDGTADSARNFDLTQDMQWQGEGHIGKDGYTLEMLLPFRSLRVTGEEDHIIGVHAIRFINRLSQEVAFPAYTPENGTFLSQCRKMVIGGVGAGRVFEVLPEVTYSDTRDYSVTPARKTSDAEMGLSLRYVSGQSVMFAATYRPDFSQIESDAPQVDVNLRNAIYYPEKRPFFLEGHEYYMLPAAQNAALKAVVHTRTIVQPEAGVKVSGRLKKNHQYSILLARDTFRGATNPDEPANVGILRYMHRMKNDSYAGVIYTGRYSSRHENTVAGFDGRLRMKNGLMLEYHALSSNTSDDGDDNSETDMASSAHMSYSTQKLKLTGGVNQTGKEFSAETGYLIRRGITQFPVTVDYTLPYKRGLLLSLMPYYNSNYLYDHFGKLWETRHVLGIRADLLNSSYIAFDGRIANEVFAGRSFDNDCLNIHGVVNFNKSFKSYSHLCCYRGIYYDEHNPFGGNVLFGKYGVELRPGRKIRSGFEYQYQQMNRRDDDSMVYHYMVVRAKTVYQFNRKCFFRMINEYNRYHGSVNTDILLSYTASPGTVVYLGYGVYYKNEQEWQRSLDHLKRHKNTLFFKASYLLER